MPGWRGKSNPWGGGAVVELGNPGATCYVPGVPRVPPFEPRVISPEADGIRCLPDR